MKFLVLFLSLICLPKYMHAPSARLPDNFVYVKDVIPDVLEEIRYAGEHNFMGRTVESYNAPKAILTKPAAMALKKVQEDLLKEGYCLKIFDAYRPQSAVNNFVNWAKNEKDTLAKQEFYPDVKKRNLFSKGYIATHSGHSRGSTVDLTIVDASTEEEIDMGSPFDFFGSISHHNSQKPTKEQKENRQLLKNVMSRHGFRPYSEEWWHYTYRNEPHPDTYFDFPVE
ncbi:M15 family metallopeptidase [Zunongwangia sp. F363]|uniref:D-alanyl-D-alanine dipeptidase n=1 Tax=Autumnicola tepida TaxID=3075595 RepID=A0ABU3CD88_9FLAO|nr:M15 family metallopeptidase [Zunongwangia sp. F363]MDT0644187.1 M15 family metallopeptidase [Zunongwangia sp. F363]